MLTTVAQQSREVVCWCLALPLGARPLAVGDQVLILPVEADVRAFVILGRLEQSLNQTQSNDADDDGPAVHDSRPETVVLEAREELTLRVGDGSITIRKDGKILIKGKDLVSHAQRVNRIKGGSVSIN